MGIKNTRIEENGKPFWNPQLTANVIKWIDRNKPLGAILCFVSGWNDIIDVRNKCYISMINVWKKYLFIFFIQIG